MAGMPVLGNSVGAGELRDNSREASNRSSSSGSRRGSSPHHAQEHETCDATVHKSDVTRTRPTSYEREYHDKVPTMATLSGGGVVTHTAPSYEEQRANPALLSRGASGTPGGRSVRDDGYCSASSTPRAFDNKSTKGSVVTLSCYKKEPKIQIEEECFYSETSKKLRTNSIKPEEGDGRETWGTGADFLLSIIGFAVDLANVWRFPYLCYRNGGGAFLIPYTLMLVFGAVPLFYMELILGQYNRQGPITLWKICPLFKGVGFCAVMVAFYVSFYYNVIIGWALYFLISSARSELPWVHCDNSWNTEQCWDSGRINGTSNRTDVRYQGPLSHFTPASEFFHRAVLEMQHSEGLNDLGFPKWQLAICLGLVYVTLYLSLFKGVKSSGKVVWLTATMPYVVLSILLARGLLLPGATRGIAYYLQPELTRLKDTQVWVDAAVQIFYSVGAGFGVHLSYASYNTFHNNCYRDCLVTTLVNCFTSFFSGFVIFTYLGFMSYKQGVPISSVATEGPGLVFQVYPEAVATLPGASLWAMLFFFMLIMLGLDSGMGGLECVITGLLDQARACGAVWLRREHFTLLVVCVSFCVACINVTPVGLLLYCMEQMGGLECVITGLLDQARACGAVWLRREHFTLLVVCVSFCVACINVTPVGLLLYCMEQMGGLECVITGLLDQARACGAVWLRREHFTLLVVCVSFCVACINVTPVGLLLYCMEQMGGLECVITGLLDQARACGAVWLRREHFTLLVVCVSFCVACINVTPVGLLLYCMEQMGGLECVITGLLDQARACGAVWLRREHFTLLVVCVSFCVACINVTPGGIYMFHLLDTYAAGISLLCSALFEAVAVSWFYGLKRFSDDVEEMLGFRPGLYWRICWKFVSPTFIIGVVVFGLLYQQPLQYQHYTYPPWAVVLGWGLACSSILMIPVVAVYKLLSTPGTFRQRLACCISPESEHEAIRGGAPVSRFSWKHWLYV
ncbi:sodium-dependent noradrenaline transporter [Helicoverpa armigera]|uniref:sodium-dependent noradrenaline transporter n=1 Tax=Helicoverpa armigera TaxID=29058 RepID=UPI003082BCC0